MTAVSLFDVLARENGTVADAARLGQKLVEAALDDWDRVLDYERQFGSAASPGLEADMDRSIYALYEKWSIEADEVLKRARPLGRTVVPIEQLEKLEDAFGRVQARLKLTPEKLAQATAQVRRGEAVPLKELQDELRTRLETQPQTPANPPVSLANFIGAGKASISSAAESDAFIRAERDQWER